MSKFLSKNVLSFVMAMIFCCTNIVYADSESGAGVVVTPRQMSVTATARPLDQQGPGFTQRGGAEQSSVNSSQQFFATVAVGGTGESSGSPTSQVQSNQLRSDITGGVASESDKQALGKTKMDKMGTVPIPSCARLLNVLILGNNEKFNEFVVDEVYRLGERVENFDLVLESKRARELDLKKKTVITQSDVYHPFCFAIHCDIAESAGDARMRTCHYVLCPFEVNSKEFAIFEKFKELWDAIRVQNRYCEIQFIPIRGKDISPDDFKTMASGIGRLCTSLQSANFLRSQELKECLGRQAVGYMAVTDVKENELRCFLDYINSWGKLRVDDVKKYCGGEEVLLDEEIFDVQGGCASDMIEEEYIEESVEKKQLSKETLDSEGRQTAGSTVKYTSIIGGSCKEVQIEFQNLVKKLVALHVSISYVINTLNNFEYDDTAGEFRLGDIDAKSVVDQVNENSSKIAAVYFLYDKGKETDQYYGKIYEKLNVRVDGCKGKEPAVQKEVLKRPIRLEKIADGSPRKIYLAKGVKEKFIDIIKRLLSGVNCTGDRLGNLICDDHNYNGDRLAELMYMYVVPNEVRMKLCEQLIKPLTPEESQSDDYDRLSKLLEQVLVPHRPAPPPPPSQPKPQLPTGSSQVSQPPPQLPPKPPTQTGSSQVSQPPPQLPPKPPTPTGSSQGSQLPPPLSSQPKPQLPTGSSQVSQPPPPPGSLPHDAGDSRVFQAKMSVATDKQLSPDELYKQVILENNDVKQCLKMVARSFFQCGFGEVDFIDAMKRIDYIDGYLTIDAEYVVSSSVMQQQMSDVLCDQWREKLVSDKAYKKSLVDNPGHLYLCYRDCRYKLDKVVELLSEGIRVQIEADYSRLWFPALSLKMKAKRGKRKMMIVKDKCVAVASDFFKGGK